MDEQPRRRTPPINGAEERLDDLIAELRGLRADLKAQTLKAPEGQVELREPRRGQQGRRR